MVLNDLASYKRSGDSMYFGMIKEEQREEMEYIEDHTIRSAWGNPYWSKEVVQDKSKNLFAANNQERLLSTWYGDINKNMLILIDGDNHIESGLIGIEEALKEEGIDIIFICNNKLLAKKIPPEYGIKTIVVPRNEPQATDKRIKTIVGQKASKGEYENIAIISQDNDLLKWDKIYPGVSIIRCKTIEDALDCVEDHRRVLSDFTCDIYS